MHDTQGNEFRISSEKAEALRQRYPDKYPVVISKLGRDIQIERRKYLASSTSTFGELIYSIRRYVSLKDHEAMFLYTKSGLVPTSSLVGSVWDKLNDSGCLYIEVHKENTFG